MRRPSSQAARSTRPGSSRASPAIRDAAPRLHARAKTSAPNASRSARTSAPTMLTQPRATRAPVRSASPSRLAVGSSATASSRRLTSPDSAAAGPRPEDLPRPMPVQRRAGRVRLQHDQVGPAGEVGLLRRMQGLAGKLEEPPSGRPAWDRRSHAGPIQFGPGRFDALAGSAGRARLGARRHANQPPAASSASSAAPTPWGADQERRGVATRRQAVGACARAAGCALIKATDTLSSLNGNGVYHQPAYLRQQGVQRVARLGLDEHRGGGRRRLARRRRALWQHHMHAGGNDAIHLRQRVGQLLRQTDVARALFQRRWTSPRSPCRGLARHAIHLRQRVGQLLRQA